MAVRRAHSSHGPGHAARVQSALSHSPAQWEPDAPWVVGSSRERLPSAAQGGLGREGHVDDIKRGATVSEPWTASCHSAWSKEITVNGKLPSALGPERHDTLEVYCLKVA